MNSILEQHRQAMEIADKACAAKRVGNDQQARELFFQAFELESRAAELVASTVEAEPTRSVLHRSAATLALDCGQLRAAERLICIGLTGNPPEEIAEELRDLLEKVYFAVSPEPARRLIR